MSNLQTTLTQVKPWVALHDLVLLNCELPDGSACELTDLEGRSFGAGILDRRDPQAAWRRFSWDPKAQFDLDYLVETMEAAVERRPEELCIRLVHSDADYLPGLTVDLYKDILLVSSENAATDVHLPAILEILKEGYQPRDIVIRNENPSRSAFGLEPYIKTHGENPIKGFWVGIDEMNYRVDPANQEKPLFPVEQREQQSLVGSLCTGRRILETYSAAGAFALQALRQGATEATALHPDSDCVKTIGANAQRNSLTVNAQVADPAVYLSEASAGDFEAIVLDPPADLAGGHEQLAQLQADAFRILPEGGLLATYCRQSDLAADAFETMVAEAAASMGREARLFARTAQPFDHPVLLNLPASRKLCGLILQVE